MVLFALWRSRNIGVMATVAGMAPRDDHPCPPTWRTPMTSYAPRRTFRTGGRLRAVLAPLLAVLACAPVLAQEFPNRPIKVVVPYSAGGASDAPMRVIAQELSKQLDQQVVVENKPGMGAMVGAELAARAAPDGYTLLLASNPQVISPSLYSKLTFDPVGDFAPISLFAREPAVLVVHPSFPAKTLAEFVAYVKERPGQVDFASSGNGSAQHLFMAMFLTRAGLTMSHIPYKGSAQVTTDLLGGQIKVGMPGLATMATHIKEGRLRALAVTGTNRSPLLPDVPSISEAGYPGFSAYVWNGLVAPKGTPRPVIDRMHKELDIAMKTPSVRTFMQGAALEASNTTPEEFAAFLREERDRSAKAVKEAGVRVD